MSLLTVQCGEFTKTKSCFNKLLEMTRLSRLDAYGRKGVEALKAATPTDTGKTANSWSYNITHTDGGATLEFLNSNINHGIPISVIIQYGHGTGTGGYVQGRDYINPALKPIFDDIVVELTKEMNNA